MTKSFVIVGALFVLALVGAAVAGAPPAVTMQITRPRNAISDNLIGTKSARPVG
jgi:hypothetical protein